MHLRLMCGSKHSTQDTFASRHRQRDGRTPYVPASKSDPPLRPRHPSVVVAAVSSSRLRAARERVLCPCWSKVLLREVAR